MFFWLHLKNTDFISTNMINNITWNLDSLNKRSTYLCTWIVRNKERCKYMILYWFIKSINHKYVTLFNDVLFTTCFNNCYHKKYIKNENLGILYWIFLSGKFFYGCTVTVWILLLIFFWKSVAWIMIVCVHTGISEGLWREKEYLLVSCKVP